MLIVLQQLYLIGAITAMRADTGTFFTQALHSFHALNAKSITTVRVSTHSRYYRTIVHTQIHRRQMRYTISESVTVGIWDPYPTFRKTVSEAWRSTATQTR